MSKIIDRRKKAMGGHSKRSVNQIKNIAVHYSATATGNSDAFERFWKNSRGWVTGGYHEVVLTNGNVELNYDPTVISNGVLNHNTATYNICYVGSGKPNAKQLNTLRERVNYNRNRLNVPIKNIKGHREFSGASTACPGLNMNDFRKSLSNASTSKPSKPSTPSKPNLKGKTADIQRWLNTYSFNNIAVDDKYGPETHKALVKVYQHELNKQFNAKLAVDGLPGPKTDAAAVTIRKGARGDLTKAMQAFLYFNGHTLAVDGIFGDITAEMVRNYQRDNRLSVDGIPRKQTFRKLIRR